MNTKTHTKQSLITEGITPTKVSGVEAIDISTLPALRCLACSWQGDSYELISHPNQSNSIDKVCPSCGIGIALQDITYTIGEDGHSVYESIQVLEQIVDIPLTENQVFNGNLFNTLRSRDLEFLEGGVIVGCSVVNDGDFKFKTTGEIQFTPPKDEIGIFPVKVELNRNDEREYFLIRFFARKDVSELGT